MSDVDRVIEAIEELPLTASINDLMTYLPSVFTGQDVSRMTENPVNPEAEWREIDDETVSFVWDRKSEKKAITRPKTHNRKS